MRPNTRSAEERTAAVKRYADGEQVVSLCKEYKVSKAGFYFWVRKAKEEAAKQARAIEIGPRGVEQEIRINKDLYIKQLEDKVRDLEAKLFRLMIKHNEM